MSIGTVLGCQREKGSVKEALPGLVETKARQLLSSECNKTVNKDIWESVRVFLAEMNRIQAQKKLEEWADWIADWAVISFARTPGLLFHHRGFHLF